MLIGKDQKKPQIFNKIFHFFGKTKLYLIRSGGLILLRDFINKSNIFFLFQKYIRDNRMVNKVTYPLLNILLMIIYKILDGEIRFSHYSNNVNQKLYELFFGSENIPHFTSIRYIISKNKLLEKALSKIHLFFALRDLQVRITSREIKQITLDVDQTSKILFGKQEGVKKGYSPSGKNRKLYQVQIWSIRETKSVIKLELRPGNYASGTNFLIDLKYVIRYLKKLGVPVTVVADSGYENSEAMCYLADAGVSFIFVEKQRKTVKNRGKNAKNKLDLQTEGVIYKERQIIKNVKGNKYIFREIFVQAGELVDETGQYHFDFASNEFTNVFVTNCRVFVQEIYAEYKKHAQVETIIEELKNDFGLAIGHNKSMQFNQVMTQLIGIAYNIKIFFLKDKKEIFSKKGIMKLSSFQREFIHLPAVIVNNHGKIIVRFSEAVFKKIENLFRSFYYKCAA